MSTLKKHAFCKRLHHICLVCLSMATNDEYGAAAKDERIIANSMVLEINWKNVHKLKSKTKPKTN